MEAEVRTVRSAAELADALELRHQVFVEGQGVPAELEHDEQDATATHVVALWEGAVVATGRLLSNSPAGARIGRMAVAERLRRQGLGSQVLVCLEEQARLLGIRQVLLHAQLPARDFYARHGYVIDGDEFMEADIRHVTMVKRLD